MSDKGVTSRGEGLFERFVDREPSKCLFETWRENGSVMHGVGLIQFWWYGYTDQEDWSDPPEPSEEFTQWLDANGCALLNGGAFGPPMIRFPSEAVAEKFRWEWHEPGAVQRRHYEAWCYDSARNGLLTTHQEMDAAMHRAKQARADWLAARVAGQQQEK